MAHALGTIKLKQRVNMPVKPVSQITDRAKRYRAQNNVKGPKKCIFCGATKDLGVMHLDGNESHGEAKNLAWGCRSCNTKLGHAFKKLKIGKRTRQYNPASGVPSFAQYAWAVSQQRHSGEHGEAGAIIHATPKRIRAEYASRIADIKRGRGGEVPF